MNGTYNGAVKWICDDEATGEDSRLSPGLALLSIIGLSGLLWSAILAPLSLI